MKSALGRCRYRNWTFHKALREKQPTSKKPVHNIKDSDQAALARISPYHSVSGLFGKKRRIFNSHQIPVSFKPTNTLRQKLVHPKDKPSKDKISNIVYAIQCADSDCQDLYIGETKQTLAKRMYQHRRASTGCGDSAVFQHLDSTSHSFNNKDVVILDNYSMNEV